MREALREAWPEAFCIIALLKLVVFVRREEREHGSTLVNHRDQGRNH